MNRDEDRCQSSTGIPTLLTSVPTVSSNSRVPDKPVIEEVAFSYMLEEHEMVDEEEVFEDVSFSYSTLRGHFSSIHDRWCGEVGKQFPLFVQTTSDRPHDEGSMVSEFEENMGIVEHITSLIDSTEADNLDLQLDGSETEDVTDTEEEEKTLYDEVTVTTELHLEYDEVTVTTCPPKVYEEMTCASDAKTTFEVATEAETMSEVVTVRKDEQIFYEAALAKEKVKMINANLSQPRPILILSEEEDEEKREFSFHNNPTSLSRLNLNQKCNASSQCLQKQTEEKRVLVSSRLGPVWSPRDCALDIEGRERGETHSLQTCGSSSTEFQKRDAVRPIPLHIACKTRPATPRASKRSFDVSNQISFPSTTSSQGSKNDIYLEPYELNTGNIFCDGNYRERHVFDLVSDIKLDLFSQRRTTLEDLRAVQSILRNKDHDDASDDLCLLLYKAALRESDDTKILTTSRRSSSSKKRDWLLSSSSSSSSSKNDVLGSHALEIHAAHRGVSAVCHDVEIPALH